MHWSKNVRVSDSTSPYNTALFKPGNDFLSGMIFHDTLFAAWADLRTGFLKIYVAASALNASDEIVRSGNAISNVSLTVVPNPVEGNARINFELSSPMNCSLTIYDSRGVVIRQILSAVLPAGAQSINYPISGLADGDYFIVLSTLNGVSRAKLTVDR
jgi:hypothetical protein